MSNLIIRLSKFGKQSSKIFNFIVIDKKKRVGGRFFEKLGFCLLNNTFFKRVVVINYQRLAFWLFKGAKLTNKASFLIARLNYFNKK